MGPQDIRWPYRLGQLMEGIDNYAFSQVRDELKGAPKLEDCLQLIFGLPSWPLYLSILLFQDEHDYSPSSDELEGVEEVRKQPFDARLKNAPNSLSEETFRESCMEGAANLASQLGRRQEEFSRADRYVQEALIITAVARPQLPHADIAHDYTGFSEAISNPLAAFLAAGVTLIVGQWNYTQAISAIGAKELTGRPLADGQYMVNPKDFISWWKKSGRKIPAYLSKFVAGGSDANKKAGRSPLPQSTRERYWEIRRWWDTGEYRYKKNLVDAWNSQRKRANLVIISEETVTRALDWTAKQK